MEALVLIDPEVREASEATFLELSFYLSSVVQARLFDFNKLEMSQMNLLLIEQTITCLINNKSRKSQK